jgi:hypothetical protein
LKKLGIAVGALVVFTAAACAVIMAPPVQQAALRAGLRRAGAAEIQMAEVRLRPTIATIGQLSFVRAGVRYDLHQVKAEFHPLAALIRTIDCERLTAGAVNVTLELSPGAGGPSSASKPAAATAQSAPASWNRLGGDLSGFRLPWKLRVGLLDLEGVLNLQQQGRTIGRATWSVTGAVAPGATKALAFRVKSIETAPVGGGQADTAGSLQLTEDPLGRLQGFALDGSVDLGQGARVSWQGTANGGGSTLRLSVAGIPIAWTNPFLPDRFAASGGSIEGAWNVRFANGLIAVNSEGPAKVRLLTASGLVFRGAVLPPIDADLDFALTWRPSDHEMVLQRANVVMRGRLMAAPAATSVAVALNRPLTFAPGASLDAIIAGEPGTGTSDLVEVKVAALPLAPFSEFLKGRSIDGTLVEASAGVYLGPSRTIVVRSSTPWAFAPVSYSAGKKEILKGTLSMRPSLTYGPAEQWARLDDIDLAEAGGIRLRGRAGLSWKAADDRVGGGIDVDLQLPFFPGLPEKRGAYHVTLAAAAHATAGGGASLSHLRLQLKGVRGEPLLSLSAGAPVEVTHPPSGEWLVDSAKPLHCESAPVSLAGINPALAGRGMSVDGFVPAAAFDIWLHPRELRLDPNTALAVTHFHLERDGRPLVAQALLKLTPSLTVRVEHHFLPSFQFHASVAAAVNHGVLVFDGARAGLFDLQFALDGNEQHLALQDLSAGCWADLGVLGKVPLFSSARLPGAGHLRLTFGRSPRDSHSVEFHGAIEDLRGRDGQAAPTLRMSGRATGSWSGRMGGFGVDTILEPVPKAGAGPLPASDAHFGLKLDYGRLAVPALNSRLEGRYVNVDDVRAFAAAFMPAAARPAPVEAALGHALASPAALPAASRPAPPALAAHRSSPVEMVAAPWGIVRGRFTLAIDELALPPYSIRKLGGTLTADATHLDLSRLSGEALGGKWLANVSAAVDPRAGASPDSLAADFTLTQLDVAQAVKLRYPNPPAGIDGKVDLSVSLAGHAARWDELLAESSGRFNLTAQGGVLRFTLPRREMFSQALEMGGALTFSKEMRALGRLLKTLQAVPVKTLVATGTLTAPGRLRLDHLHIEAPQLQLDVRGSVANAKVRDLMGQPMKLDAALAARGDLAVILDGMHLLDRQAVGGYRALTEPFTIGGQLGQPDLHPFYDLLARAVQGSHGSWGLLMREAQSRLPPPKS